MTFAHAYGNLSIYDLSKLYAVSLLLSMLQNKYYSVLTFPFGLLPVRRGVVFWFYFLNQNGMGQLLKKM